MAVEGNGFADMKAFHDDKAQRIAKRVCFVLMGMDQSEGALLVGFPDPLDPIFVSGEHVQKSDSVPSSALRANEEERAGLDDNDVRCHRGASVPCLLAERERKRARETGLRERGGQKIRYYQRKPISLFLMPVSVCFN